MIVGKVQLVKLLKQFYTVFFTETRILSVKFIVFHPIFTEMAMALHSSTLAWKIPWAEEPGRLQSMGSLRVGHDWVSDFTFTFHFHALEKEMATHSSVLAWRIPGTTEPGVLPSMASHRVGQDWSDLAVAVASYFQTSNSIQKAMHPTGSSQLQ